MGFVQYCKLLAYVIKKTKKNNNTRLNTSYTIYILRLHPILNYFLSVPEWHRFLLDKGVDILDLPMILLHCTKRNNK